MNADFDAFASMLAAKKLYPDALVVFPGSQEKNLRNFFIQSMGYLLDMTDIKDIDFKQIKRLVLVDTRQANRIGKLSSLLDKSTIDIHIYDHHPSMANDIKGNVEIIQHTGATVTILTDIIKEKNVEITPDEATIMCLGIYEDTGSFSFPSTTERDFMASAFLLSKGANLNIIANLTSRELSPKQIELLNEMIQTANHLDFNGVGVVITSVIAENYVSDFAFLVHKMIRMQNVDAVFAIAQMENKVHVVARSRTPEVDAGSIVSEIGGGGHTYAAAATIREKTLTQIEHQLIEILYKKIKPKQQTARELMSAPPITAVSDISCKEASKLLTRYNINALLVANAKGKLLGYITRQIIEKALFHKLDNVPIGEYMMTEMSSVGPDADISEIQEKIIQSKQRILPVINKKKTIGVVTRTDLLNVLIRQSQKNSKDLSNSPKEQIPARTRNVGKFMKERLSERIRDILSDIGKAANEINYSAYVVGGFVRDLFLYRKNEDLDIVIEGDGIAFAKKYSKLTGSRMHAHEKFGTAVIIFPDGFKIDIASARMEYYQFPAAMPTVEMSSIKLDLFRRDFTINSLAIALNPKKFGTLVDFFLAQKDIKGKTIRVLHNLSFVEDPTRVFRAIRFEQRFGFIIGKLTSGLIENAVTMDFFKQLSGRRVFSELRQIFEEENPTPAIIRLNDYKLLPVIHPSITLSKELISLFNSVKKALSWYDLLFLEESYMEWAVYFLALIRHCDKKTSDEICQRFELAPRIQSLFCKDRFVAEECLEWIERNVPVENSRLFKKLSTFKTELILYMMAATRQEKVKKAISDYFTKLRPVTVLIKGKDLQHLGLKPGPLYRDIFQAVLDAKLNGNLKTKNDELAFIENYVQ
ncbi:MAG: CBS domain-containing protein [Desulfobacterales bacterium]|nr:CBS domain-containing protein [Desulfobacterales bacterium]